MPYVSMKSPIGDLTLFEEDGRIVALDWGWVERGTATPLLTEARNQLDQYFDGERQDFDLPLAPNGSLFQKKVWASLQRIPYGQVRRYGELATELESAPRAVGGACARNPLPIIVPCHRVVGSGGSLGGYSGLEGLDTKRFLLSLEGWSTTDA